MDTRRGFFGQAIGLVAGLAFIAADPKTIKKEKKHYRIKIHDTISNTWIEAPSVQFESTEKRNGFSFTTDKIQIHVAMTIDRVCLMDGEGVEIRTLRCPRAVRTIRGDEFTPTLTLSIGNCKFTEPYPLTEAYKLLQPHQID